MMLEMLERWINPLRRRVLLMIGKAVLNSIKDSNNLQLVQVNMGNEETIDAVERIQNFGFTSHPKTGAQAIVVFIGGNRDHPVVIAADDGNFRKKNLASGDSCMYNADGITLEFKGNTVQLQNFSSTELGAVALVKKLVNETFMSLFNAHYHTGVTTGPGSSGPPATPMTVANLTSKVKAE